MGKNILVTGGAGYIGSHTVRYLSKKGDRVIVYDNFANGHRFAVKGAELIEGDIGDYDLLKKTLQEEKIDAVIHFAAATLVNESVESPRKYYQNNVSNGLLLLNAMIDVGVKKIVFSSSCATYGTPLKVPINEGEKQSPINPYGRTKLMFEHILKDYDSAYGLKSVCLRYFNAAGADAEGDIGEKHDPETHIIPILLQVAKGERKIFSVFGTDYKTRDGSCMRDYVHVTDLADAHSKAVDFLFENERSDCFNVGTGDGYTVLELIDAVKKVTSKDIPFKIESRRPGDPDILIADTEKARTFLNWVPQHSGIDNIIATAWKWHSSDFNK
jgi:UDP-glucose-4-epimerase